MFTYIMLYRYTAQGLRAIKDAPARMAHARRSVETAGGTLKAVYATTGQYDVAAISEWPSEESAMTYLLAQAQAGNVTSETLRAFDEAAFARIVDAIP